MNDKPQQPIKKPSPLKTLSEVQQGVSTTLKAGKAVVGAATDVTEAARQKSYQLLNQATRRAGRTAALLTNNRILRRVTGLLRLNWLLGSVDQVDVVKAEAAVRKLQQQHPQETPNQIAHRIMVEKSVYAGGVGLATSLVPGEAIALLAVDLATTARIQSEMVYQIAAAYGLDLKDSDRKGEVLAIFGLALGGSRALRVGLDLLRNVPVAGAVIGASANATIIYALGYAACRFYEAKLNGAATGEAQTLAAVKEASDKYLEVATKQQALMDQILVNMILASHPEKSWAEIMPDLQALNLSPSSMEIIANIKSPQPLDGLLNQLNGDFAMPLLAQCYRIAQVDGVITPLEMTVLKAIATKFNIDLNSIQSVV